MSAFVLLVTVIMAVGLGIFAGYGTFLGILHAFGRPAQGRQPVAVLIPSQSHASGD